MFSTRVGKNPAIYYGAKIRCIPGARPTHEILPDIDRKAAISRAPLDVANFVPISSA